jgi:hypothetical protein
MVVSLNPAPSKEVFQLLLNNTLETLESESKLKQELYLTTLGTKLEDVVAEIMTDKAKGTPFENSIELIGGQKFPDIIANKYYGVEVKTTKQNHWTTTGNSVMEGTRVDGIEKIYMLFGKMVSPIEFKCRPYEDCLSEVVVTHSPRYLINMNLESGNTIFDKLELPYETLRKEINPVKPIIEYYRKFLKPGDEVWWIDQDESKSSKLIIQLWNNLTVLEREELRIKAMVLFPEIFSNKLDKYSRLAVRLVNSENVVCPNVRDHFSAGGQGQFTWNGVIYYRIPKIIINLIQSIEKIKDNLQVIDDELLVKYWNDNVSNKNLQWINLIVENTKHFNLKFDLKEYLKEML